MPDKFNRPTDAQDALYHDVLCGDIERVRQAVRESPELIEGQTVIGGAWSHGGRRCGAQDDVIVCLRQLFENGANFKAINAGVFDTAFKAFPRAAALLFEFGAKANQPEDDGTTGLHYMAAIGNRYACEVLLEHGADINAKTDRGETPLDVAVKHKLPRMIQFLRKRGAQSAATDLAGDSFRPMKREIKRTEGRCSGEVTWYREDRGYGYLRDNLREGPRAGLADRIAVYGELFFDRDSIIGDEPPSIEEGTALSFEVANDEFGLRATNIEFGTIDAFLHSYCGDTDGLRLAFAEGADPGARVPNEGATHLHNLCYCRQGLRRPQREDLHVIRAGLWNDEPWIEPLKLVIKAGCDVNAQTNVDVEQEAAQPWRCHGETALHLAAASWALNLVKELLAAGADKNIRNAHGETPYRWAVRHRACQEIKTLLLPDGDRKDEDQYPYQWYSDAWAAFFRADEDDCLAELKYAIDLGLDPNDDSGPEGRPLMQCANFGQDELIEYLLSVGAEVTYPTETGSTPLHIAAMQGHTSTVKLLLRHGADPNARTRDGVRGEAFTCPYRGETPLHFAAAYGDIEMVNALVDAGADRFAEDACGATVLDYYRRHRGEKRDDTDLRKVIRGWSPDKEDKE